MTVICSVSTLCGFVCRLQDAACAGTPVYHFSIDMPITINIPSSLVSSCVHVKLCCALLC